MLTNNQPFISVIIPVYNGEDFLVQCLDGIFASEYNFFEVIVADDGSTDKSAAISRAQGANVLSTERRQSGPAAARNIAAEKAVGDILLFVDADVVVNKNTLTQVAAHFQKNTEISALFGSYDDAPFEQNFLSQYRNLLHHYVHQNSSCEASTFWAGLGAIRREVFLEVGGFDANQFPVPSIEDIELGTRLRSKGYEILLAKEIQVKHLKKWSGVSMVFTDVFCRALPWSKLILTKKAMINDLNLKSSDRLSAMLVGAGIAFFPFIFWMPMLLVAILMFILLTLFLNRQIFFFFTRKKGIVFAVQTVPWQLFYFFYSGSAFVSSWIIYVLPNALGFEKRSQLIHFKRRSSNTSSR